MGNNGLMHLPSSMSATFQDALRLVPERGQQWGFCIQRRCLKRSEMPGVSLAIPNTSCGYLAFFYPDFSCERAELP